MASAARTRSRSTRYADLLRRPGAAARRRRPPGLDLLVLDAPHLYDRPGNPYLGPDGADWPDNCAALRGARAGRAPTSAAAPSPSCRPDIVHAHDWQAALAPAYLRYGRRPRPADGHDGPQPRLPGPVPGQHASASSACRRAPSRSTASNIMAASASSRPACSSPTAITTVSPTYAQEIRTPEASAWGCDGLLQSRAGRSLTASSTASTIDVWNPATDPHLAAHLRRRRRSTARAANKRALAGALRPRRRPTAPLFVRGQPADLAEGPGPAARGARRRCVAQGGAARRARLRRRRRSRQRFSRAAARPSRPRRRASSAMTSRCRTCSRAAATPSWSRRASSPAA